MMTVNEIISQAFNDNSNEIDLSNMKLNQFPEELFNLKNLRTIKLMHNSISKIPSNILDLHNLENLYLYSNNISSISDEILLNMPYLQNFDLAENPIDYHGKILFYHNNNRMVGHKKNLKSISEYKEGSYSRLLKSLSLYNKSRILPNVLYELTELETLSLNLKELTQLPEDFCNLINLKHLDLSNNKLQKLPENFHHLIKLESLNLSNNCLTSIPENIWRLPNLKFLNIDSNQLNSFDFTIFSSSLDDFSARDNSFENFNSLQFDIYDFRELKTKYNQSYSV